MPSVSGRRLELLSYQLPQMWTHVLLYRRYRAALRDGCPVEVPLNSIFALCYADRPAIVAQSAMSSIIRADKRLTSINLLRPTTILTGLLVRTTSVPVVRESSRASHG